jgi:hypothetical protein
MPKSFYEYPGFRASLSAVHEAKGRVVELEPIHTVTSDDTALLFLMADFEAGHRMGATLGLRCGPRWQIRRFGIVELLGAGKRRLEEGLSSLRGLATLAIQCDAEPEMVLLPGREVTCSLLEGDGDLGTATVRLLDFEGRYNVSFSDALARRVFGPPPDR